MGDRVCFVGLADFTATAQLRLFDAGGDTLVRANLDNDLNADFELLISDGEISAADYDALDFLF